MGRRSKGCNSSGFRGIGLEARVSLVMLDLNINIKLISDYIDAKATGSGRGRGGHQYCEEGSGIGYFWGTMFPTMGGSISYVTQEGGGSRKGTRVQRCRLLLKGGLKIRDF